MVLTTPANAGGSRPRMRRRVCSRCGPEGATNMIRQAAAGLLTAVLLTVGAVAGPWSHVLAVAATTQAPVPSAPLPAAAVVDARVLGDKDRTRFILDLNDKVQPVVFPLADPYRL